MALSLKHAKIICLYLQLGNPINNDYGGADAWQKINKIKINKSSEFWGKMSF